MSEITWVPIEQVKENPTNPRNITASQLEKLKKSIKQFPQMLDIRPLVVDETGTVLGGNMRLTALKELGYDKVPIIPANNLTEQQKKEFVIKDNLGYGEWNWDVLRSDWDIKELDDWGLEILDFKEPVNESENPYSKKVQAPIYTPSEEAPTFQSTYDTTKYDALVRIIESSSVNPEIKDFLKLCAVRHIVFNYELIADFYAHADTETQELMETSALVIIDYDRAIELGYVKLGDKIMEQYNSENYDEE
jgi:hypothetical protein